MAGTLLLPEDPTAKTTMADRLIPFIHYVYPAGLFVWFVSSQAFSICTLANLKAPSRKLRRFLFVWMQLALLISYVAEACILIAHSLFQKGWWSPQDNVIYLLSSILVWGVIEVAIIDTQNPVWYSYYGAWGFSFFSELGLLIISIKKRDDSIVFENLKLFAQWSRIVLIVLVPGLVCGLRSKDLNSLDKDEESAGLLNNQQESGQTSYGTIGVDPESGIDVQAAQARMQEKLQESGSWWTYVKSFAILWKYVWPNERKLQLYMVCVGCCLLIQRWLNVMVPHQLGVVTTALKDSDKIPWIEVIMFVVYRWLDSASGIQAIQNFLWIPVEQYSYRSITTAAYNHVMSLSYDFHTQKQSGELWMSISQGRSVNGLIELVVFAVLPMITDLCIAFSYLYWLFNAYMALIVATVSIAYIYGTAKLSTMRNQIRRELNQSMRQETNIMVETVSSWTTVSYFNRVPYEQARYHQAIRKFQDAEFQWQIGVSIINAVQSLIFTVGLLAASFLAVYEVSVGNAPVGSFVTLLLYWAQLSRPLAFFSNLFRRIQAQMLDAERVLELFQTTPSVVDRLEAKELTNVEGEICFKDVGFSYDARKTTLKDINFEAPPGSTVALVGETGGGKTTCLKLLFRFYDVQTGSITVDGHDIRDLRISDLRDIMGVVPQDPKLFNDTIINNIKYANFDSTDEDVYEACRAASIHDKILSFPDGYLSRVGENGIRLSGGELQRVAIARAILRNPKIILLDEATSMVDMETERQIQLALQKLSKDRTVIVVAHRLSTIMNADLILVIGDGSIVEKGNHEGLMATKGKYFQLFSKQLKNETKKGSGSLQDISAMNSSEVTLNNETDGLEQVVPKEFNQNQSMLMSVYPNGPMPTYTHGPMITHPMLPTHMVPSHMVPYHVASNHIIPAHIASNPMAVNPQPMIPVGKLPQQYVTFSLPTRNSNAKQIQGYGFMNPWLTTPRQSILNGFNQPQYLSTNKDGPPIAEQGSGSSGLKPDAVEFIPQSSTSNNTKQDFTFMSEKRSSQKSKGSVPMSAGEIVSKLTTKESVEQKVAALESRSESNFRGIPRPDSVSNFEDSQNTTNKKTLVSNDDSNGEMSELNYVESDVNEAMALEKRKRSRVRRRPSNSLQLAEESTTTQDNTTSADQTSNAESISTSNAVDSTTETNSEMEGGGSIRKPRRRFRSLSRPQPGKKFEQENSVPNVNSEGEAVPKHHGEKFKGKSFKGPRPRNISSEQNVLSSNDAQSLDNHGIVSGSGSDKPVSKHLRKTGSYSKVTWRKDKNAKNNKDSRNSNTTS